MKRLSDGSLVPSTLTDTPTTNAKDKAHSNSFLKQGTVVKVIYPDDPENSTGNAIEYDVQVIESDQNSGTGSVLYQSCRVSDAFASSNNFLEYTLQAAKKVDKGLPSGGAQVLLLAIDGRSVNGGAVIVGGLASSDRPDRVTADGQFYDFQFNGIHQNINKDGEYLLEFNSPIDQDGKKANESAAGTKLQITKEGKFIISDNKGQILTFDRVGKTVTLTNGNETLLIDQANKIVSIQSSGDITETAKGAMKMTSTKDMSLSSDGGITQKAGKDLSVEASSNIKEKAGANWQVEAGGNVTLKAGGNVSIEGGAQAQLKGTINMIGDGSVPAAGVGISQCFGIGNLGAPVMSNIITGSSTVLIGT